MIDRKETEPWPILVILGSSYVKQEPHSYPISNYCYHWDTTVEEATSIISMVNVRVSKDW